MKIRLGVYYEKNKRIMSIIGITVMMLAMTSQGVFAKVDQKISSKLTEDEIKIISLVAETPKLTPEEAERILEEIDKIVDTKQLIQSTVGTSAYNVVDIAELTSYRSDLDILNSKMSEHLLVFEDDNAVGERATTSIYASKPIVPDDTNYIEFYGINTYSYVDGVKHDVFMIVASSAGYSNASGSGPLEEIGSDTLFSAKTYVQTDFSDDIDMITTIAPKIITKLDKVPVIEYIAEVYNLATYFNPTSKQKVVFHYDLHQTFVYTYVAEPGTNAYTHMQTAERISGSCDLKFYKIAYGNTTHEVVPFDFTVNSENYGEIHEPAERYADYELIADMYQVGKIKVKVGNSTMSTISMDYRSQLSSLPY